MSESLKGKDMKKVLTGLLVLGSISSFASMDCKNMAKNGAIRAYHSEMGTVQGSEGIEYGAKLVDNSKGSKFTYLIDIYDNNEDGDAWTSNYLVEVSKSSVGKCSVLSAQKIGVVF